MAMIKPCFIHKVMQKRQQAFGIGTEHVLGLSGSRVEPLHMHAPAKGCCGNLAYLCEEYEDSLGALEAE